MDIFDRISSSVQSETPEGLLASHVPFKAKGGEPEGDIFDRIAPTIKQPSFLSRVGSEFGETAKEIGPVYPALETGANLFSQLYGVPASGLAGLAGLPFGKSREAMEAVSNTLIYQPQTEKGKSLTERVSVPFSELAKLSEKLGDFVLKETGSPEMATVAATAVQAAPLAMGLKGKGKTPSFMQAKPMTPSDWGELARPLEVAPELQRPALPGSQGFTLQEAPPKTILRENLTPPRGQAVDISPSGEPIYRPGQMPVEEVPFQPIEPKIPMKEVAKPSPKPIDIFDKVEPAASIKDLQEHPNLADYVIKRPQIHEKEVIDYANQIKEGKTPEVKAEVPKEAPAPGKTTPRLLEIEKEENVFLAKSLEKELSPEEIARLKSLRFEAITEGKKVGLEMKGPSVAEIKTTEEKPSLSPTAKDQFALPSMKVGLEMKGAKEGTPSLEGTPLMEAAVKAEKEKIQPKLPLGEEVEDTIRELRGIVKTGQAGGVLEGGEGRYGSSMKIDQMLGQGIKARKYEVLKSIDKALNGEKLTVKQQEIFDRIKETAQDIIDDRKESDFREVQRKMVEADKFLKDDTISSLTTSADDEIMGIREGLLDEGFTQEQINAAVEKVRKTYEAEGRFRDLEGIKKELTEPETPPVVKETLPEKPKTTWEKLSELEKPTEKPETFRKYVESQGEKWPITSKNPKYEALKSAWNTLQSEKGAITLPVEEIKRATNRFREFWSPLSTLPQKEQLKASRYKAMGDMARTERIVERSIDLTKKLSDKDKLEIFEAMDGRRDPATMAPEDAAIVKEFTTINNLVGKMLVDRDLISQKAYEKHKGQYIKYAYLKHFLGEDTNIPMGRNGKIDINALKARKDLTVEQKKAIGWIEDVSVAEPLGLAQSLGNVVKYDYLEQIAADPRNVWTPSIVNISDLSREYPQKIAKAQATRLTRQTGDPHGTFQLPNGNFAVKNMTTKEFIGKKMGIGELSEETELYQRMAKENPNSPEIAQRVQIYERYLNQAKQATQNVPDDFVQMPAAKTWGPLAGSFVRKEVARDIQSFYGGEKGNIEGLSKTVDWLSTIDAKATGLFKVFKVPLNLPTVVRNTVSNMIQLHMSGMHPWEIPEYMVKTGDAMLSKSPEYTKAYRHGLFKTNWSVEEIREVMDQFRSLKGHSWGKVVGTVQGIAKYYGKVDDFFKMAKYLEQRESGASVLKAINEAQKWGMDYSLADPSIKWARKHFIPFVSYQYKIAPLIAETAIKRPWVLGEYLAIPYAMGEIVKEIYKGQMTESDWKDLERTIPAEVTRRQSFMIVPWKINDKWYWFDYSYFMPWGNYIQAYSGLKEGDIKSPLVQFGVGGTPLITLTKTFTSSGLRNEPPKDSFSGYPIYNQLDDPMTKALKVSEYLYNQFAPSMLTRYGALGYTFDIGKEDRYGRTVPAEQAVGKLVGVNLQEANPKLAAIVKKARIGALKDEYIRINLDPKLSLEQKEKYAKRFQTEIANISGEERSSLMAELRQSIP